MRTRSRKQNVTSLTFEQIESRRLLTTNAVLVADIAPGTESSFPGNLFVANDTLFFRAFDGVHGDELWKTDGTREGTQLVKDIDPGIDGSFPIGFQQLGESVYFSAFDPVHGAELWKSDGTPEGTVLVQDIAEGQTSSVPGWLTKVGDELYFTAFDEVHGTEIRITDGTDTRLIGDIIPGADRGGLGQLTALNDELVFFDATTDEVGNEPWVTDGTESGTFLLQDIFEGPSWSLPQQFVVRDSTFYFGTGFGDFWRSDGTVEGTERVLDANGEEVSTRRITAIGQTIYLVDSLRGRGELWRFDASEELTLLRRFDGFVTNIVGREGLIYFCVQTEDGGHELWKSDGSSEGTTQITTFDNDIDEFMVIDDTLFFTTNDRLGNIELWQSDGTDIGTSAVTGSLVASMTSIQQLTDFGGRLFFTAFTEATGLEIFSLVEENSADIDADGVVGFSDFLVLSADFGITGSSKADLDSDGSVTFADFLILSSQFGTSP